MNQKDEVFAQVVWRRGKAQKRHQHYQRRAEQACKPDLVAWLRAVERDDMGDPYEPGKCGGKAL